MKLPLMCQCFFLSFCLMLPSCEGIDPALLGGGPVGGGGYSSESNRYAGRGYSEGYERGYSRPDYYREPYREPVRPLPPQEYEYGRGRYDSGGRDDRNYRSDKNRDKDYFGGSKEWYKSGYALGKKDRREHKSSDYQRHRNHYDGRTRSEFAAGYQDGYSR
jgi:hypothetical protein